ncbi:helical backbone metal receptor [Acidovorax sp. CCYZU-2555]|uniref:ABC transporter substrate-binding protein n=1 Tax=Acidovorax sp. CCYZU-2555 TaxID=2835042 RepID=UPI001BCE9015|nr:helical backbone metal receptor [Acidovorax sp. CCYZU-2555]MBS7781532.1 ABC transporter substrate-binding protein [Acidovorax sp. CCYZU-2555]
MGARKLSALAAHWLLAACALLAASAPARAYGVRDAQGRTVEFAQAPQRIVSLLPSVTESLCALGACARLVGVDAFSNHPPEIAALPRLGKPSAPSIEAIVRLRPDVVLMAYSPPLMAQLAQFGIPVLALDAHDIAGMRGQWRTLDTLLQQQRADALNARLQAGVERVARSTRAHAGRSVYFEVDATPYAAGPHSFIGELLAQLGARNIVAPALGPFPRLSPEYVVRQNPQIIIHTPETPAAAFAQRPGWRTIDAVRSGRICTLSTAEVDLVSRPGPRLDQAAEVLARCLALTPPR